MNRYAAYTRVSRVAGRDERLHSPEWQRDKIDGFARGLGLDVEHHDPELDVSGSKARRPILDGILAAIERGEYAGIIVADIDRLSRLTPRDRIELFDRIEAAGGKVLSASQNLDADTPEGRFQRELFLSLARMQWERYRDQWEHAKRYATSAGIQLGRAPFGYGRDSNGRLVPNENAPHAVEAFRLVAEDSLVAAARYLNAQELVKANGTPHTFTSAQVSRFTQSRAYLGEVHYADHEPIVDAHPAIVDRATWLAAQRPKRGRRANTPRALSGLLGCGRDDCGGHLVSSDARYRCSSRQVPGIKSACGNSIDADAVEQLVADRLAELIPSRVLERENGASPDYAEARAAVEAARSELAAYVEHTPANMPGYAEGLKRRADALEATETRESETATQTTAAERCPQIQSADLIRAARGDDLRSVIVASGARITITRAERNGSAWTPLDRRVAISW